MRISLLIFFFGFLFFTNCFSQSAVISEVYGGGGNSGATYKNDFIELYNPTSSPISLVGWSVQYASAAGTTWQVTNLSGSIAAHSYFLIQEAAGTGGTASLPTPDVTGTINMSGTAGKVALVNSTTALSGACPSSASIIDLVGFGSTANCSETTFSPAPSNTTSIERKANSSSTSASMQSGGADEFLGNGYDDNNNSLDFVTRSPQPQNSSSPTEPDATPPSFTNTYPKVQSIGATGFDVVVNLTKTATVYVGVYIEGGASVDQIRAGQDVHGNPLPNNLKLAINVTATGTDFTGSISGLSPSTFYYVYFLADNGIAYYTASVGVTTLNLSDATPPNFVSGYPKIDPINPTGFRLTSELDESGKTFFVIVNDGSPAPTSDQIKNGNDANGILVANGFAGTISVSSANAEFTSDVSVLTPKTAYDVYMVAEDNIPNLQTSPTKISIVTGFQFTEDFEACESNSFTSYNVLGAQTWGCVNFGYNGSKGYRMNGFSGSAVVNEDWLISPLITLSANASLSFYSQFSFAGNSLQLKISTDYTGAGDPTTATWINLNGKFPTTAVGSTSTSVLDWTLSNVDLSAYTGNAYLAFVYTSTSSAAARWTIDNIKVNNATASYLQVSPTGLSFGATNVSKSYSLSGINLQNDVTVTAPPNFQVSKDNSVFASSISYTANEVNSQQTVYVNFNVAGVTTATYTGSVVNSSPGVSSKNIAVSGTDKSQTFNIATYNMEFFGTDVKDASNVEFGPTNDALQVSNVTTVMQIIAADVFAVEEIADDNAMNQLVSNLPGYSKVVSDHWSYSWQATDPYFPPQKTGFIYNTSKVQLVSSRVMFASMYDSILAGTKTLANYPTATSSSFWSSGRLPFMATFDVTINGTTRRIRMIDIHGKSASDQVSYNRRQYDANVLRDSLNAHYKHDNIILLGDFNDDVYGSITPGAQSSYKSIVDDATNFNTITYALNQSGASTFPSSTSFIDNIIISNELSNAYVNNSVTVEDPRTYINNYSATTSDHLPVSARFLLSNKTDQTITFNSLASRTFGDASITLGGTSSSGMIVTYSSSDLNVATVNGNTLTIIGAGTATITASQAGNSDFNSAVDVPQTLIINKADQSITFNALKSKIFGDAAFNLDGSASSGLTVSYASSDPTIASISNGNLVTILKIGSVTITASQTGNTNYNAAGDIVQLFTIIKANQAITFNTLASKTLGDAPFNVSAIATSGLAVTFASSSDKIVINGTQVTLANAGRASITASQAGDTNYNSATSIDQSFCINPMRPTISLSNQNTSTPTLISSANSGNQWYWNGTAISGATNNTLNVSMPGIYTVQVQVDDCVSQLSDNETIIVTGLAHEKTVLAYPNPAEDYLFISCAHEITELQLFDLAGKSSSLLVEKYGNDYRSNVKELSSGFYVLRVNQNGLVSTLRFIKK